MSDLSQPRTETTIAAAGLLVTAITDQAPDPTTIEELHEWLAIESDDDSTRLGPEMVNAFAVDALTIAAIHGVVGNFTYDLFPRAAQFVRQLRMSPSQRQTDAAAVTAIALNQASRHASDPKDVHLVSLEQRTDRSWKVSVSLTDGQKIRTVKLSISESGEVVASKRN